MNLADLLFSDDLHKDLDFRRKLFHMMTGFIFIIIIYNDLIHIDLLKVFVAISLVVGLAISLMSRTTKLPVIHYFLENFERRNHINTFPGKGAFFFLAGVFVSITLFEKDVSLASISILALGDTFAHFVGKYYGKTRLQISRTKLLEGTIAGIIVGALGAMHFVNPYEAIFGAMIAMFVEAIELEYFQMDDNLSVPLAAGIAITLFRLI
jgi:dolichol kinase